MFSQMAASGYYIMAIAIAGAFFFIVWGLLNDVGAETPWITSGVGASVVLLGAVALREGFLRRARHRAPIRQAAVADASGKLTIEVNAHILKEIKKRSDAANVLDKLSAAHREVFELCGEYLSRVDDELKSIRAGSPRLEPILRGRKKAAKIHRFHMLRWAEIEATDLTIRSQNDVDSGKRLDAADKALQTVNTALSAYPAERALLESHDLLSEMVVSLNLSRIIQEAERAVVAGETQRAIAHYRDALMYLGRDNISTPDRERVASHIQQEIESLRQTEEQ